MANRSKIIYIVAPALLVIVALVLLFSRSRENKQNHEPEFELRNEGPVIAFGGDVNLGRRQNHISGRDGFARALRGVSRLAEADLAIANLECVLASGGEPADKGESRPFHFRGRPEQVEILHAAGIDVVATANNHSGDYGSTALFEQHDILERAGIGHAGTGRNRGEACAAHYSSAGELVVATISVDTTKTHFSATADAPGSCHVRLDDLAAWQGDIARSIADARKHAHIVLVAVHWGRNHRKQPTRAEVAAGHALIDAGADAVLGSSAHILQGVEVYRGRPIIHDAGNLLFDSQEHPDVDSAIFSLRVGPEGVHELWVDPIVQRYGFSKDADNKRSADILELIEQRSSSWGTPWRRYQGRGLLQFDPPTRPEPQTLNTVPARARTAVAGLDQAPPGCRLGDELPASAAIEPIDFGPMQLVGIQLDRKLVAERRPLWVTSYWRKTGPIPDDRIIRLRAIPSSGTGRRWGGDHEPCDWAWPTSRWHDEQIYRDRFLVRPPPRNVEGDYALQVGVRSAGKKIGRDRTLVPLRVERG